MNLYLYIFQFSIIFLLFSISISLNLRLYFGSNRIYKEEEGWEEIERIVDNA